MTTFRIIATISLLLVAGGLYVVLNNEATSQVVSHPASQPVKEPESKAKQLRIP